GIDPLSRRDGRGFLRGGRGRLVFERHRRSCPSTLSADGGIMATNPLTAVAISGSPSRGSRSRLLLTHAVRELEAEGVATSLVDLAELPADALLGRRADPALDAAFARVSAARIVVASTPVYRATY